MYQLLRHRICCQLTVLLFLVLYGTAEAQQSIDITSLYARNTLYAERMSRRQNLYKYGILPLLKQRPDSLNEYSFTSAMWNISQYMLRNDTVRQLIDTLFNHYPQLETSTRRSLMEVVYGLYPMEYTAVIRQYWLQETDDRLLAILTFYLKNNGAIGDTDILKRLMQDPARYDSSAVLQQLDAAVFRKDVTAKPDLKQLFAHQQVLGCKVIYSLQRPDRNYQGLAIVQYADGSFARDNNGRLKTFVQLARSAANLPYFITNGNTPQGAYRVHGTAISFNNVIGPTPNLQLWMPFEVPGDTFFIHPSGQITSDILFKKDYLTLFPAAWQNDVMMESFHAGKCGRGAIIAHGTTIDPWFYQGQPFYPCTPTLGCLCARELWNFNTGRILQSDQLNLVNTFLTTPGADGYLFVINLGDEKRAVTAEEAEYLVGQLEKK